MKILFVFPDMSVQSGKFYPGVASLSAYLKQNGHKISLLHVTEPLSKVQYFKMLVRESPDLIGFSATTVMFTQVITFAKWTKEYADIPIICGGIHATLCPEEAIRIKEIDMVCLGEGEEALSELCFNLHNNEELTNIKNIWVKQNGNIYKNPLRPLIHDLDSLPFPDREVFNYAEILDMKVMKRGIFMASRGCPYQCTYCSNHALQQIYKDKGRYVRFRSVDNLIKEIEEVLNGYPGIEHVAFHDDILPLQRKWFEEFCEKYAHKIKLPFEMNCTADLVDREMVKMAKMAGCRSISLGIESGNNFLRFEVLNRPITNDKILNAFSLCRVTGIQNISYNMIGIPFENVRRVLDTVKINAKAGPVAMHLSVLYPFPGTKLHEFCHKHNFLTNARTNSYYEESVLSLDTMTKAQIRFLFREFRPLVRLYSYLLMLPSIFSATTIYVFDTVISISMLSPFLPVTQTLYKLLRIVRSKLRYPLRNYKIRNKK